jgi:hypothetical protein
MTSLDLVTRNSQLSPVEQRLTDIVNFLKEIDQGGFISLVLLSPLLNLRT